MINRIESLLTTALLASVMAALPLSAQAASPVFNNWSVNNGAITGTGGNTVPCAPGFTCETLSIGDGFIQVQWVDTNSNITYIFTGITEPGATGNPTTLNYVDQSFVRLGSENGIMAQQRHIQTDAEGTFSNTSQLNIGWANPSPDGNNPTLSIEQSFASDGGSALGDEFSNTFVMLLINGGGANVDRSITVDQRVGLGDGVTASDDVQRFVLEGRQGAFTTPGSLTLGQPIGSTEPGGGTVTWAAGNDIMVRWLGQRLDLGDQGASAFGFQGVINNTTDAEATTFSTSSTGIVPEGAGYQAPFDWHATFGPDAPTPALPDP